MHETVPEEYCATFKQISLSVMLERTLHLPPSGSVLSELVSQSQTLVHKVSLAK